MSSKFLTPNVTDLESPNVRRFFVCPAEIAKYLTGALDVLCHGYNWEPFGDADVQSTIEKFEEVIASMTDVNTAGEIFASTAGFLDYALKLDGSSVATADYPKLRDVCPLSWLVSAETIVLPDMTGAYLAGASDLTTVGTKLGSNTHTLSVDELPAHSHAYAAAGTGAATLVVPDVPTSVPAPGATGLTGGNLAHNNMPLSLAINWFIRYE